MSFRNAIYVDALIDQGADIHLKSSFGSTPTSFAYRPHTSRYLVNLVQTPDYQVSRDVIYSALSN